MRRTITLSALIGLGTCTNGVAQSNTPSEPTTTLQTVSILGVRAMQNTPMSYSNLDKKDLSSRNLGQDIPYLLQLQPSVVSTSDAGTGVGYTTLRVRGINEESINVSVNGVPLNNSESQGVFWVNMPDLVSSLQEVQLQRGVGTSTNGATAFGATLNMCTDNLSRSAFAQINLGGGSYGLFRRNMRASTGLLNGHWVAEARLSKITNDGYIDRSGVNLTSYFAQAAYLWERGILKFVTFGGKERVGISWSGISPADEALYGRRYNSAGLMYRDDNNTPHYNLNTDNYTQLHHQLILDHNLASNLKLNLTAHYTSGYGYTDEYRTDRKLVKFGLTPYIDASGQKIKKTDLYRDKYLDNDFYGAITSLQWTPRHWHITYGLSASHYHGSHYGEIRWIKSYPTPIYPNDRYYESTGSKTDLSTYLKANYQLSPTLSLYSDLQYRFVRYRISGTGDHYDETLGKLQTFGIDQRFHFFNPKLGLFYQIAPQHHAYASLAIAHRDPTRTSYTETTEKELPRAERLLDYEAGYAYHSQTLDLKINGYYMAYKDQLVFAGRFSDVGGTIFENVPDSYRLGVETSVSLRPVQGLRLDASAALSHNKIKEYRFSYSVYNEAWKWAGYKDEQLHDVDIANSPNLITSGAITYTVSGVTASLVGKHVGKQYIDNTMDEQRSLPSYTTASLYLGYDLPIRFVKKWSISLQINNLFNRKYRSSGYVYDMGIDSEGVHYSDLRFFPQAPINCMFGTSITL